MYRMRDRYTVSHGAGKEGLLVVQCTDAQLASPPGLAHAFVLPGIQNYATARCCHLPPFPPPPIEQHHRHNVRFRPLNPSPSDSLKSALDRVHLHSPRRLVFIFVVVLILRHSLALCDFSLRLTHSLCRLTLQRVTLWPCLQIPAQHCLAPAQPSPAQPSPAEPKRSSTRGTNLASPGLRPHPHSSCQSPDSLYCSLARGLYHHPISTFTHLSSFPSCSIHLLQPLFFCPPCYRFSDSISVTCTISPFTSSLYRTRHRLPPRTHSQTLSPRSPVGLHLPHAPAAFAQNCHRAKPEESHPTTQAATDSTPHSPLRPLKQESPSFGHLINPSPPLSGHLIFSHTFNSTLHNQLTPT
ncbi:Ubiquitin carboxyl-terminal hydrolase isozyme L3 [Fusarium oxysporum f. sp. albedinis]|nr:Ubiquitin carboxyl-terminal hydrolase isozyme L3 [Fusarium oxysporum f. sp. albedinis]